MPRAQPRARRSCARLLLTASHPVFLLDAPCEQDPGRVWPGKRMEGRMGGQRVFARNLQVYRIDTRYNIVFVTGNVPGAKNVRWRGEGRTVQEG